LTDKTTRLLELQHHLLKTKKKKRGEVKTLEIRSKQEHQEILQKKRG